MHKDEIQLIIDLIDLDGLSPVGRHLVLSAVVAPPAFADAISPFGAAPDAIRYALMLNLLEVAWANDLLAPEQDALLSAAQAALGISDEQYRALWRFVRELRAVRLRGQNDSVAAQATRVATGAAQPDTRSAGIWLAVLDARRRTLTQILARRRAMAESIAAP